MNHAESIGIIGGADGPTAIFITGHPGIWFWAAALLAGFVLLAIGAALFRHRK